MTTIHNLPTPATPRPRIPATLQPRTPMPAAARPNFASRRWTSATSRPILLGSSWGTVSLRNRG